MTDKPIIIDGVDVRGCSYAILPKSQCPQKAMLYAKEVSCIACKENNTKLNFCKNNHNCNYKQLQRKTAECEKLKKAVMTLSQGLSIHSNKLQIATEALGLILNGYGNDELDLENDYNPIRIADEALEQLESEE